MLVFQFGFQKASENILNSPPAMLSSQEGLREMFMNSLSWYYSVFNSTTKEFDFGIQGGSNSKIHFMNHFQMSPKHKGTPVSYRTGFILFLIGS